MSSHSRTSTHRRRRWLGACLVVATGVVVATAGCSAGSGDHPAAADQPTTTTPTTEAGAPTSTTQGSAGTTSGSRSGRQPSGTNGGSRAPQQKPLPFAADTRPDVSTVREGYPVLVSVTQGEHPGYRRYVFTFRHADPEGHQPWRKFARPAWDARYVPSSQAVEDGSGEPVVNAGAAAHLRIVFHADMHYADGRSSLERSINDFPYDLVFAGDFENRVTWFYGAAKQLPFRVEYVGDGRVAVDIVR
ncbi:MAG TPA: hypothetical protein VHG90_10325 [Acidimicrobiales bacterium]|nr:hypothetical protein [Acidimicrobiales bacterium]